MGSCGEMLSAGNGAFNCHSVGGSADPITASARQAGGLAALIPPVPEVSSLTGSESCHSHPTLSFTAQVPITA